MFPVFFSAHVKDLDEVLLEVNKKAPQRPIAVVGFSCGSGGKQNEANMFMKMVWFKDGISSRCPQRGGVAGEDQSKLKFGSWTVY